MRQREEQGENMKIKEREAKPLGRPAGRSGPRRDGLTLRLRVTFSALRPQFLDTTPLTFPAACCTACLLFR